MVRATNLPALGLVLTLALLSGSAAAAESATIDLTLVTKEGAMVVVFHEGEQSYENWDIPLYPDTDVTLHITNQDADVHTFSIAGAVTASKNVPANATATLSFHFPNDTKASSTYAVDGREIARIATYSVIYDRPSPAPSVLALGAAVAALALVATRRRA